MTRRQRLVGATLAVILVVAPQAAADPAPTTGASHIASPSTVKTDGGTDLRLPPGYFLDEPTYSRLDVEMRRLQDAETNLTAQNKALRTDVSGFQPGWKTLAITLASGIVLGWTLREKL